MSIAVAKPATSMTAADFLAWNDGTDTRYELIDGRPVAMNPPRLPHSDLTGALALAIGQRLTLPCRVSTEVGIRLPDREDTYYQADAAVSCSARRQQDAWIRDPVVIIEVLSASTAAHDRDRKGRDYRLLASVQEIVFVSSSALRVEVARRVAAGWSSVDSVGRDGVMTLQSLDLAIPLSEIYQGIALEPEQAPGDVQP